MSAASDVVVEGRQLKAVASKYDGNEPGAKIEIHSHHYAMSRQERAKFYRLGQAPSGSQTAIPEQPVKTSEEFYEGKDETHENRPTPYMANHKGKRHALPTNFETRAANDDLEKGNIAHLVNWLKYYPNMDSSEIPQRNPITYGKWRAAGEDYYPSLFDPITKKLRYGKAEVKFHERRKLHHGNEKDTSFNIDVQPFDYIAHDGSPDYNKLGSRLSTSTKIIPAHAYVKAKKDLMYAPKSEQIHEKGAANDAHKGEDLEHRVIKHETQELKPRGVVDDATDIFLDMMNH